METTVLIGGKVAALVVGDPSTVQSLYPSAVVRPRNSGDVIDPSFLPTPPSVDLEVTAWQLREALNQKGLRAAVEAAVAASPQRVKDEWEFKATYRRSHPTVALIASAINKTPQDIDEVFSLAATLA